MNIQENGCRLHPDCFTCPLPDCLYRSRNIGQQWQATHARVMELAARGAHISQISQAAGVSERTVYRHLHQFRGRP